MIIYHPIYDIEHGRFRLLHLLSCAENRQLFWNSYRILDIIYLFPQVLIHTDVTRGLTSLKRKLSNEDYRYNRIPNPKLFIEKFVGIHESIVASLLSNGILNEGLYDSGIIGLGDYQIPDSINKIICSSQDHDLVSNVCQEFSRIPVNGPGGLKARTKLLEHRYDTNAA